MDKTAKQQPASAKEPQQTLDDLKAQLLEKDNDYKRALADYQNLQKQTRVEREQFAKMATALFLQEVLVPFDHLEMTAEHVKDPALELVIKQFRQVFEREGVQEIAALGKPFDHNTMEAIDTAPGEKDKVLKVTQKGYTLYGTLLRPARVVVGNGEKQEK